MAVLGHRFTAADVGVRQPAKWVDSIGGGMQRGTLPLMTHLDQPRLAWLCLLPHRSKTPASKGVSLFHIEWQNGFSISM